VARQFLKEEGKLGKNRFPGLPGNMGNILKQAQQMQDKMAKAQDELKEKHIEASSGGGMVTVKFNGRQEIESIKIDPQAITPDDPEMLEDLVLAAVREGLKKSLELQQSEMSKITGGMSLPGLA
jgi:nucleoid-associated protein EbfC